MKFFHLTLTAGNIVFVGQSSGQFQAYNAWNGKLLWGYQTGAGADDTPAVFEENGQEEVAFLSAGNSLEASPHGNTLWIFGLNGKLGGSSVINRSPSCICSMLVAICESLSFFSKSL